MSLGPLIGQALRYGSVGLIVLAIDFATYVLALALVPGAVVAANLLGKAAGAISGFFLHRSITFRGRKAHSDARQIASYLGLLAFNATMSSALLWLAVEKASLNPYWSKLAIDVATVLVAFIGSKLVVWKAA